MAETPALGAGFGKRVVRFVLALVALLILRAILGVLPMLKNASPFGDSLMSPLVLANAGVDITILLVLLSFGVGLGRSIHANYGKMPDLGTIVSLLTATLVLGIAYSSFQTPVACLIWTPANLATCGLQSATAPNVNFGDLGALGQQLSQAAAKAQANLVTGSLIMAMQAAAVGCLTQPPDLYGWVFLILIAIPVVAIAVLVARNLDTLTELLFRQAAPATGPTFGSGHGNASRFNSRTDGGLSAEDVERLTKLKSLMDSGLISKDDFETQKKRILGLTGPDPAPAGEAEELRKLKALLDAGALTQEEYEVQKLRFLDRS